MRRLAALALPIALFAAPASADEITDTLNSALEAYEAGDVQYALEELAYAQQLLQEMKSASLTAFLPEPPPGWTRSVNTNLNQGLAMMGGGVGAEAEYSDGTDTMKLTIMADNPMVTAMAGIFGNPALGKMVRVGRQKFVDQDGDLSSIVGNRVLVQAENAPLEIMLIILELIDYRGLGNFGT